MCCQRIKPTFIKLDAKLGALMLDGGQQTVRDIIRIAQETNTRVLAEAIETEILFTAYRDAGVELFQGYLFGAPERHKATAEQKRQA